MMIIPLLLIMIWSVLVRNSLESLGETFRVVLQWSGRNSMVHISGCPY